MIKKLSLLRHGQSADKQPGQTDIDRQLTARGRSEVANCVAEIKKLNIRYDLVISSTAARAKATTLILAGEMPFDTNFVQWNQQIYEASTRTLLGIIATIETSYTNVLLVGHNPSISSLANFLIEGEPVDLPPAGMMIIEFPLGSWGDVKENSGILIKRLDRIGKIDGGDPQPR